LLPQNVYAKLLLVGHEGLTVLDDCMGGHEGHIMQSYHAGAKVSQVLKPTGRLIVFTSSGLPESHLPHASGWNPVIHLRNQLVIVFI
jgi:hypothetical protein